MDRVGVEPTTSACVFLRSMLLSRGTAKKRITVKSHPLRFALVCIVFGNHNNIGLVYSHTEVIRKFFAAS